MIVKSLNLKRLVINLAVPLLAGAAAGLLSPDTAQIYKTLEKPLLSPPGILFPAVWTVLYILMGISAYMITEQKGQKIKDIMKLYYIQLFLNFLWPVIFFTFGLYWAAAGELVILWAVCILVFWNFFLTDRTAAWLFLPTIIWVSFAGYLNVSTALLN
ncbi:MAG: TspO/MBR family protein [Acutalibacteraceae bacterium]